MHNCKTTRSSLIDLVLGEPPAGVLRSGERTLLLDELAGCSDCRAEYAALRRTLGIVDQAAQGAVPVESFWPGYHSRLSRQLKNAAVTGLPAQRTSAVWLTKIREIAGASVRIPMPVAALLLLFFGGLLFLAVHSGQVKQTTTSAKVVETKTIEVPVIREKVVTRVVYLASNRRSAPHLPSRAENLSAAAARSAKASADSVAGNLSGFKPTDQVKLTIIKGSYHDDK
jgi:hypothetical protein